MIFTIIDYLKGNLKSVQKGIELLGASTIVTSDSDQIEKADALILPGVGAFADAMHTMNELGQSDAIRKRADDGVPFLGICLGMQLIYDRGLEGALDYDDGEWTNGLALLDGDCVKLPAEDESGSRLKIPHVGVNSLEFEKPSKLFAGIPDSSYFYFTHSYYVAPSDEGTITGLTTHGYPFASAIEKDNIYAVQFHPEKSSDMGLRVLKNFIEIANKA